MLPRTAGELLARKPKQEMSKVTTIFTDGHVTTDWVPTKTIIKTAAKVRALPWVESVEVSKE